MNSERVELVYAEQAYLPSDNESETVFNDTKFANSEFTRLPSLSEETNAETYDNMDEAEELSSCIGGSLTLDELVLKYNPRTNKQGRIGKRFLFLSKIFMARNVMRRQMQNRKFKKDGLTHMVPNKNASKKVTHRKKENFTSTIVRNAWKKMKKVAEKVEESVLSYRVAKDKCRDT
jgi:hypothetical protein